MPEEEVSSGSDVDSSSEQADGYKALLSDLPGSSDPEANLVHDPEEARVMAEAGDAYRTNAAKERKDAAYWSGEGAVRTWGHTNPGAAQGAERRAEGSDTFAEQVETWAQALHRHPELQGKAFDGEPLTPETLIQIERDARSLRGMIQSVENRIAEIPTLRWEGVSHVVYRDGVRNPLVHNPDKKDSYVMTWKEIDDRLSAIDSDDATTIGDMKLIVVGALQEANDKLRVLLEPRQGLLDALKS